MAGGSTHEALDRYELHLRRRHLRPGTIDKYRDNLRAWLGDHPDTWQTVTTGDLERWLDGRNIGARTRYYWVSCLHGFYQWACDVGLADDDPAARAVRPRLPQLAARPLREVDAELVMAVTVDGPRRVACALMLFAGLRCCEVAGLRWRDVDEVAGRLRIVGKGGRTRWVPIGPRLAGELNGRRGRPNDPVTGVTWTAVRVSQVVGGHLRAVGVDASAHQLRHTFATRMYACPRGDLAKVQRALGHASVATTQIYVGVSDLEVAEAVALVG